MAEGRAHGDGEAARARRDFHAPAELPSQGPIIVGARQSAASASQPDQPLDDRYQAYESNPAPWWIGLLWICFLVGGATYLIVNLIE